MFYILKTIIIELLYLGMERTRHSIFQLAKFRMSMKSARLHSRQGFSVMRNTVCCFSGVCLILCGLKTQNDRAE